VATLFCVGVSQVVLFSLKNPVMKTPWQRKVSPGLAVGDNINLGIKDNGLQKPTGELFYS
jgi:hypothetical protein